MWCQAPQQRGTHPSAVQGDHRDTRTALHITITAVKEGKEIKKKKIHPFAT